MVCILVRTVAALPMRSCAQEAACRQAGVIACSCTAWQGCQTLLPFLQEEEEENGSQGMLEWHPGQKQQQYALPGREAPLLLQSRVSKRG